MKPTWLSAGPFLLFCLGLLFVMPARAATPWFPFGPDGGDARAFASDPHDHRHLYLGTVNGSIFDTHDGGATWKWLARVGQRDDLVLDNIVVDPVSPSHIFVGAWVLDRADGGLYTSTDNGKTWKGSAELQGHSIRALTVAPSQPHTLVAGALDGVFQSTDSGQTWKLISPAGSSEIHEIESIAIDPKDPKIIYAGTWHLPWKTTDGGEHWDNIKEGIIDDSDVFSIIVDPATPSTVYVSACSGIYKSTDAAAHFTKVQGIPSTARRTRVLMLDPKHTNIVFAGTTEGLFRTSDAGQNWLRNAHPEWIVNDVFVDPEDTDHVLLATDRNGVLLSSDGGMSFVTSNRGFSARQVTAYLADRNHANRIYLGVINDKEAGGVFVSDNGGLAWRQMSEGLGGADIFSLSQSGDGGVMAGSRHGVFRLTGDHWQSAGLALSPAPAPAPAAKVAAKPKGFRRESSKHRSAATQVHSRPGRITQNAGLTAKAPARAPDPPLSDTGVFAMLSTEDGSLFAATGENLLVWRPKDQGWRPVQGLSGHSWRMLASDGSKVLSADLNAIMLSQDRGETFHAIAQPKEIHLIAAVAIDGAGRLWIGGREGVFVSEDDAASWHAVKDLFVPDVSGIYYDREAKRLLITSTGSKTFAYSVALPDLKVQYWDTGWPLRMLRPVGDHLMGVTAFDGIVLQPRMVNSEESAGAPSNPAGSSSSLN